MSRRPDRPAVARRTFDRRAIDDGGGESVGRLAAVAGSASGVGAACTCGLGVVSSTAGGFAGGGAAGSTAGIDGPGRRRLGRRAGW